MNKSGKVSFYDQYHKKNRNAFYYKVITDNNFTYFYTLRYLKKALELMDFIKRREKSPSGTFASIRGDKVHTFEILDLGCGVGTIDFFLAQKGYQVTGIDISADAIKICNTVKKNLDVQNATFIQGDVQKVKFAHQFDLIICSEVIEHVEKDTELVKTIFSLLKSGGVLLLTTPSIHAPLYRLGLLKDFDQRVGHLRRYTLHGLVTLIEQSGFEIREKAKAESVLRNALYTFPPLGYLIKIIRGPLVSLFHVFDQLFTTLFGESDLVIIAEKHR